MEFSKRINKRLLHMEMQTIKLSSEPLSIEFQDGDIIKNRYKIYQQLGKGCYSIVYKALDMQLN